MKNIILVLVLAVFSTKSFAICYPVSSINANGITSNQATLYWPSVSGALDYVSVYRVSGSSTWISTGLPSLNLSVTLTGLSPSTLYEFGVQTRCAALQTSAVVQTQFTTLAACTAPGGLSASAILYTSATLNWNAAAGAQSYTVEYKANSSATWILLSSAWMSLSYNLSGLAQTTAYTFRVRANCGTAGSSSYTQAQFTTLTIPCPQPTSAIASGITSSQATVTWNAGVGPLNYTFEYKANSSATWISITVSQTTYTMTGLNASTLYDFRVRSNCSVNVSPFTQGQFTTLGQPCATPSGLSYTGLSSSQVTLHWNGVSGALYYVVEFKPSSGLIWLTATSATTASSYLLTGLLPSTIYDFRVKADCSPGFAQGQFTTFAPPCQAPTGLMTTGITSSSAALSWNAVSGAAGYELMYTSNPASGIWSLVPTTTQTSQVLNSLLPATTYTWQVKATCSSGSSSTYVLSQFTTSATNCSTPSNLTSTSITGTSAFLQWDNVSGASGYNLQYRIIAGAFTSWIPVATTSNSYALTGLQFGAYYEWQVQTVCLSGNSLFTNSEYLATLGCSSQTGTSMSNPVFVGQVPCASNAFVHTSSNSYASCFTDNLTAPDNQPSPDIWYQFALTVPSTVKISHCGTFTNSMNTYLHLLDQNGVQLFSNNDNGPLCIGTKASMSVLLPAGTYYAVSEGYQNNTGSISTMIKTTLPCSSVLNLKLFFEGYYIGAQSMTTVMLNQNYIGLPPPTLLDVDDITVELRDPFPPYLVQTFCTTRLHTDGSAVCVFPPLNGHYVVTVRHRQGVQTWSMNPVYISSGMNSYDFSTSSAQAYGQNMKQVEPGVWALYAGDIDQSENVDLLDLSILEFDINSFMYGYLPTDLNGDGNVDLLDLTVLEDNIKNFIYSVHP